MEASRCFCHKQQQQYTTTPRILSFSSAVRSESECRKRIHSRSRMERCWYVESVSISDKLKVQPFLQNFISLLTLLCTDFSHFLPFPPKQGPTRRPLIIEEYWSLDSVLNPRKKRHCMRLLYQVFRPLLPCPNFEPCIPWDCQMIIGGIIEKYRWKV